MNLNCHKFNYQYNSNPTFSGTTRICAITDSHQDTRKECGFLTQIAQEAKANNNILALNCGDLFKGIYPRELEVESYLELKRTSPNLEIVMTLGNNDFGFNKEGLDFLQKSIKKFSDSGINVVCANVFEKDTDKRPSWIKPYTVVKRNGDKIFITGFCVNSVSNTAYGVKAEDPKKSFNELKEAISKEKPDGIIILNHDWFEKSEELVKFANQQGIKIDLLIGGHEHERFEPNKDLKIYYPEAFNGSMYKFDLTMQNGISKLHNIQEILNENLPIAPNFEERLIASEKETKLLDELVPSVLNLTKHYSNPCPLGSFLADAIKGTAKSDIAFFSTGFLMAPLLYKPEKMITLYDFKKVMMAQTQIQKIEITPEELKQVFDNAMQNRMIKNKGNAKFLQCSNNMKIVGRANETDKTYKVEQIYIDNEPLFYEATGNAIEPDRKISCAIDPFIGSGGHNYGVLKSLDKELVMKDGKAVTIDNILLDALKDAAIKYPKNYTYPEFKLIDL